MKVPLCSRKSPLLYLFFKILFFSLFSTFFFFSIFLARDCDLEVAQLGSEGLGSILLHIKIWALEGAWMGSYGKIKSRGQLRKNSQLKTLSNHIEVKIESQKESRE